MSQIEVYETRAEWLAARGIGASSAPIILGLSEWGSPYALWAEMTGLAPRNDDEHSGKEWLEWGLRLEGTIAEAFAEKTVRQVQLRPPYSLERHADHPWLTASPDADQRVDAAEHDAYAEVGELPQLALERSVYAGDGLLQIKTANAFKASEWRAGVPLYYQVQLQHEMLVTGKEWATLCVLIGGSQFKVFPDVRRDDRFIKGMLPKLAAFQDLVETETEPPIDNSDATARALQRRHFRDNDNTTVLPAEAAEWDRDLVETKQQIKELEARKKQLENQLKAAIGNNTFGLLPCGERYKWGTYAKAAYTVQAMEVKPLLRCK